MNSILIIAEQSSNTGLTLGGWVTMLLSVGFVTGLLVWCIYKVLTTPGETEHLHSPADIQPPDTMQP